MESRVVSTGKKSLTESKELTSWSIEIKNLATSITGMETTMDKRFDKLENRADLLSFLYPFNCPKWLQPAVSFRRFAGEIYRENSGLGAG
jgi:hypothetical protein